MIDSASAGLRMLDPEATARAAAAIGMDPSGIRHNIFRFLLRNPAMTERISALVAFLFRSGSLDDRVRELVIMRIGFATGSAYEWAEHWSVCQRQDLDLTEMAAVREWRSHAGFGPRDRLALQAADDVVLSGFITPDTWTGVVAEFGPELALELLGVISAWRMMSTIIRSIDVPLDEGAELWPPDGRGPSEDRPAQQ